MALCKPARAIVLGVSRLASALVLALLAVPFAAFGAAAAVPSPQGSPADAEYGPYRFVLAKLAVHEGRYSEALEELGKLAEAVPDDPYVRIELAELLLRLGRAAEATTHADRARELAPENPDALRIAGRAHLARSEREGTPVEPALSAFEALREVAPQDLQSLVALGEIYLTEGRPEEAADVLSDVWRFRPRSRMIHSFLIDSLTRAGRFEEAEVVIGQILEQDPSYLKARMTLADLLSQRGDHRAAAAVLGGASEQAMRSDMDLQRRLALELYRAGQPSAALLSIERVLEAEPEHVGGHYLRALILAELGRSEEAEAELRELQEASPENREIAVQLARVLEEAGSVEEAAEILSGIASDLESEGLSQEASEMRLEEAFLMARAGRWERALELTGVDPSSPDAVATASVPALMLHLEVLDRLGRQEAALALLSSVSAAGSHTEEAPRFAAKKAELLSSLGRTEEARALLAGLAEDPETRRVAAEGLQRAGLYEDAVPLLEQIVEEGDESLPVLFSLGASYERSGRWDDAVATFRSLVAAHPDHAPSLNYLGYMWAERGENLEEARALIVRAVDLDPENGAYLDSLGWVLFQLGELEEARTQLERAADLEQDDAVVLEHLGDVYRRLGQSDLARRSYRRAAELGGDNLAEVERKLAELGGP